jgi:uncharacterized protein DUF87
MTDSNFYLGRAYDPSKQTLTDKPVTYDPADLTTHAVVTGMTGSGKTGLCITLLEEAALAGIPAIIIDPKGDLTNLLLHFPDLAPQDFQPWIDSDLARRAKKTAEQAASETAESWRKGLSDWGIASERILALKNAAQFAIFTPGSNAGIAVSVLSSLAAPDLPWQDNREILRERISSTVTALLGLVGYDDIDPIRSREHILLSNIFEFAWSQKKDIKLDELVVQVQNPPFDKLGAFPLNSFFPEKDRMELAMVLNNILASPGFETWRDGQPMDIASMLYTKDGHPRHSIFYLAHLSDTERMFFVTLLLSALETWMRMQKGATSLRALLYMDEIFGYLPPQHNPSSKPLMLRMLKQARAFGLGLLLATQNPVDVDYKALSNAGTWFIGKLQTEQDKNRLLDGLESAAGGIPRSIFDKLISTLGKRVFVLHNIHAKAPELFQTRWTMNFLAGPLTRTQIPDLNKLVNAEASIQSQPKSASVSQASAIPEAEAPSVMVTSISGITRKADIGPTEVISRKPEAVGAKSNAEGSQTKPSIPAGIREYFLPLNYSLPQAFRASQKTMPGEASIDSVVYRPTLLALAKVRVLDRKLGVDSELVRAVLVDNLEKRGSVRWDDFAANGPALEKAEQTPVPGTKFSTIDSPLNDTKLMTALQKDFADWALRTSSVKARANTALKVFAGPDVSQAEFMRACADTARELRDKDIAKQAGTVDRQLKALQDKLAREERELQMDQNELAGRKREEGSNLLEIGASVLGVGRKRSITSQFSKNRLTNKAKADVEESIDAIAQFKQQIAQLQQQREQVVAELANKWGDLVNDISEVTVNAKKTDVFVALFGVAWLPYYNVSIGGTILTLPAFGDQ